MFNTILNVITPIFLVMGAGSLYARFFKPDQKTLSSAIIYLLAPTLVIEGFSKVDIPLGDLAQIGGLILLTALTMTIIGYGIAALLGLDRRGASALVLAIILFNGANYGVPFNTFAYGDAAENIAIIYYSVSVLVINTLGMFIASRGGTVAVSVPQAMMNIIRTPLFGATVVGFGISLFDVTLPLPLFRMIDVLSDATIPLMLVLIGVQLTTFKLNVARLRPILVASATTLIITPLVAWIIAALLGMEGLTRIVGITQHAMPTAVIASAFATQFDGDTELVTGTLLVSTAASLFTLSLLVELLV